MKKFGYLLDTNICAFFLRGRFDVDKRIEKVGWDNCYISQITVLELKFGVELAKQRDGKDRTEQLNAFLSAIHILPIEEAMDIAAKEKIRLQLQGTPIFDNFDLLIGCSSLAYNMVMVTENLKDFKNLEGIKLENWIARDKGDHIK